MKDDSTVNSVALSAVEKEIVDVVAAAFDKHAAEQLEITTPPDNTMGDYAVPCFNIANVIKRSPVEVAQVIAGNARSGKLIERAVATGPYVNFFVNFPKFAELTLIEVARKKAAYGKSSGGKKQTVMVEYFSPNTNKPLTIGHVRNFCLGSTVSRLLKFLGYRVVESTLYNDRGIAIAKTMVGYQKWGQNKTPADANLKPDHFVGSFYVRFAQAAKDNPELEAEAKEMLVAWEAGDTEVYALWKKLMTWVREGFVDTLKDYGIKTFDNSYVESEFYKKGKDVVEKGLKKGVFIKGKDGVIYAPLEQYGLPDKVVLRPNDTSLYITQDLYLAYLKDKYKLDRSVYVVGNEQDLYLKQLFKILELLGFKNVDKYTHLSYGMIRLPSGKIKSREGLIPGTGADDLLLQLRELAAQEIKQRDESLSTKEVQQRSLTIALAAVKYYILSVDPKKTMVFDPKQSIAFVGNTGPYLQYVVTRINSIFEKVTAKPKTSVDFSKLTAPSERTLVKLLAAFPQTIHDAGQQYNPAQLSHYLYELAKTFSVFYEAVPVIKGSPDEFAVRLLLLTSVQTVLKNGLGLLGIDPLEKM